MNWNLLVVVVIIALMILLAIGLKVEIVMLAKRGFDEIRNGIKK